MMLASYLPAVSGLQKTTFQRRKLGVALVGLGGYSTGQLGPALQETEHCYLAGIVTGTPEKEDVWAEKYNIPRKNIYNYENYDQIADNEDIDIVYVALPNSMHAEYTIRAARAGKHVISEKPMATSSEDCRRMIEACKKAGKKLSIGYRLHFEPHHLRMMELGQKNGLGKLKKLSAGFSFVHKNPNTWRLDKEMAGGGPLMDLGIYCLQGCIYTAGEIPVEVTARDLTKKTEFFKEVEGTIEWELKFPSGFTSVCTTSYEDRANFLKAEAEEGVFELSPAFGYGGIQGRTPNGPMDLPNVNQQALQMDDFALCIKENRETIVPGEMGLRDVYIMEKIYEAARTGKAISLKDTPKALHKI